MTNAEWSPSKTKLNRLVEDFIAEIEQVVRRHALRTIESAIRGGRPSEGAPATTTMQVGKKARGRQYKRTTEQVNADAARILDYVRKNPDQRAEQIKAALRIPANGWALPITKLTQSGQIVTSGAKRGTTYNVRPAAPPVKRVDDGDPITAVY